MGRHPSPGRPHNPGVYRFGRGELFAALAAIGYGSAYVATAFALRSFEPLPVAVYRSVLAAIALAGVLLVIRARGRAGDGATAAAPPAASLARPRARPAVRALHLVVIALCGGPIFLGAMNLAVAGVGATIASFVAGLYAVLAAVLAPFLLRERLRPAALVGFLAALLGTALLAELDLGGAGMGGIAWGLVAAVSFALFLVLSRKWSRPDGFDAIAVTLANMVATTVGLGGLLVVLNPGSFQTSGTTAESLIAVAWLGFVAAAGQALAVAAVKLVPASRSSAFLLLNPIAATILSLVLLGQVPTPLQALGGLLVLAGIAAATMPLRFPRRGTARAG
jgi:drug/metabolite transporter (DMT)-like permease